MAAAGLGALLASNGLAQEKRIQIAVSDTNGDGKVSREEFVGASKGDKEVLEKVFGQLDGNGDGELSMNELMVLMRRGEPPKPHGDDDELIAGAGASQIVKKAGKGKPSYAVVMSSLDASNQAWRAVGDALVRKHGASLIVYTGSVTNALESLRTLHPRYTAFVARPEILGRIYVARVHRMTRRLDDDPYGDTQWGIVSAASPTGALHVALATEPAVVRSGIGLTGVNDSLFDELLIINDGKPGEVFWKKKDGKVDRRSEGDADRVKLFTEAWRTMKPQALVGSGHATERNLEMPFSKGNTEIRGGRWVGLENWRTEVPIEVDTTPRVFMGAGNCLIGNFQRRTDSMPAVLMDSYGFNQFVGYTVPTWYGKGGWGALGMWQHFAGTLSLGEAWFYNNQVIIRELLTKHSEIAAKELEISEAGEGMPEGNVMQYGKDAAGMLWDRDVVAFYGDPALRVLLRKGDAKTASPRFTVAKARGRTLKITCTGTPPECGDQPLCLWLDSPAPGARVSKGAAADSLVTNDFLLLFKPEWKKNVLEVEFSD